MGRFINPFTDMGFKRIFGQEATKDLLIEFLNDLLVGEKQIKDIRFLDKELIPEFEGDRGVIYDIYCTTEEGEHLIVEMQNKPQARFRERALYYLSNTIVRQGAKGAEWKFNLKAVYGIFFMNFNLKDASPRLKRNIMLQDTETHETFSDKLRFIFIELPCFKKTEEDCKTDFERWIYVLKNMEILERMPFKARKAAFEKLEKITDIAALSKEDRMKYDESIKVYRDYLVTIEGAVEEGLAKGMAKGLAQGMEKGMAKGFENGLVQGIEKGIAQGMEKGMEKGRVEVARNMKSRGMSFELIADITHIPISDIENL